MRGARMASIRRPAWTPGVKSISPRDTQTANKNGLPRRAENRPSIPKKNTGFYGNPEFGICPHIEVDDCRNGFIIDFSLAGMKRILQATIVQVGDRI